MTRRTYEQIFLDRLKYMAGEPPARVSSRALKEALGWEEDRYASVRSGLIRAGVIKGVVGGPGGSLEILEGADQIAPSSKKKMREDSVNVFISYSHVDSKIKNELINHLAPLRKLGLIKEWHDGEIKPGDEWNKVISNNIETSRVMILLISSDFVSSEYCYDKELKRAMQKHNKGEMIVIPVIVRPCLWEDLTFGKLQALPDQGRAITSFDNIDEALTNVAKGMREAVQSLTRT